MKKLAYEDWELRDFFRDTSDPVEQVFICAELCDRKPIIMLQYLISIGLVDNNTARLVVVEIQIREQAIAAAKAASSEASKKSYRRKVEANPDYHARVLKKRRDDYIPKPKIPKIPKSRDEINQARREEYKRIKEEAPEIYDRIRKRRNELQKAREAARKQVSV